MAGNHQAQREQLRTTIKPWRKLKTLNVVIVSRRKLYPRTSSTYGDDRNQPRGKQEGRRGFWHDIRAVDLDTFDADLTQIADCVRARQRNFSNDLAIGAGKPNKVLSGAYREDFGFCNAKLIQAFNGQIACAVAADVKSIE